MIEGLPVNIKVITNGFYDTYVIRYVGIRSSTKLRLRRMIEAEIEERGCFRSRACDLTMSHPRRSRPALSVQTKLRSQ